MNPVKKLRIFYNKNDASLLVYETLKQKLLQYKLELVEENAELNIAIGGDGAFIRMLKATNYNRDAYYVGINTGTLGFLQEVEVSEIDDLLNNVQNGNFKICTTAIQKTIIETINETREYLSFNEIIIRRADLGLAKLDVFINDENAERFVGDAIIVATSVGSTAHASSYGAAIVHELLHTLQLVPVGAFNSTINQTLKSPLVLPDNAIIQLMPLTKNNDLMVIIDGENYLLYNTLKITTTICEQKIKRLRLNDKTFYKKVKSKFVDLKKERD